MEDVVLSFDRTDGGYWLLEGRARDGVWVRLRIEHFSMLDADDVQAEIETQTAGDNRPTYKPVGEEFCLRWGRPRGRRTRTGLSTSRNTAAPTSWHWVTSGAS